MFFLTILALILATLAWDAARKVSQRREEERAARAAYFQSELDRMAAKRRSEDHLKRLSREAEQRHLAALERRQRYYAD